MHVRALKLFFFALLGVVLSSSAFAMGHGHGVTKIDFCTSLTDFTDSRLFAKLLVTTSNGNVVSGGKQGKGHGHGHGHSKRDHDDNDDQGDDNDSNETSGTSMDNNGGDSKKHGSGNFSLAGQTITLSIGSAVFTGVADSKGRVTTPFNAKLVAHGQILMIKADGLNLVELFPLDPTDGPHEVTVHIEVTATPPSTDPAVPATPTSLSSQDVTFFYLSRDGKAKGRNF
jgi:hypothetical protein